MELLKKYLKKTLQFLKTQKYKWLAFFLLAIGFFLIRFPYEEAVLYFIDQAQKNTKYFAKLKYGDFYIHPIGPKLVFKEARIFTKSTQKPLRVDQLSIRPSYQALLRLKLGAVVNLKWSDSNVQLQLRKTSLKNSRSGGWLIQLQTKNFKPSVLQSLSPVFLKTKGLINARLKALIDPHFEVQPNGFWQIEGQNIQSQILSYTFPGTIGTISLPHFKWRRISSKGHLKEGELIIADISIGTNKDKFQLQSKGSVFVDFKKLGISSNNIKPRLKSYYLGLDIVTSLELKPKLYFLDLFLSAAKTKTPNGLRYIAEIKGNAANFFNLTPVSELPSLEQMRQEEIPEPTFKESF